MARIPLGEGQAQALYDKGLIDDETLARVAPAPEPMAPDVGALDENVEMRRAAGREMIARQQEMASAATPQTVDDTQEVTGQEAAAQDLGETPEGIEGTANSLLTGAPQDAGAVPASFDPADYGVVTPDPYDNQPPQPQLTGLGMAKESAEQYKLRGEAIGEEQAAIYRAQNEALQAQQLEDEQTQLRRAEDIRKAEDDYQKAFEDIANTKIERKSIWQGKTTGEKIMAGIALALGTIGGIASGGRNYGAEQLIKTVDKDLDDQRKALAQKKIGLEGKATVLAEMRKRFKDEDTALAASRAAGYQMLANDLEMVKAKTRSSDQKLKADQAIAAVQMKADEAKNDLIQRVSMQKAMATGQISPEMLPKDQRERYVKGHGLARNSTEAAKLDEAIVASNAAQDGLKQLLVMANKPLKSVSLDDRAKADTIATMLQGALRLEVLGPGTVQESEREMLRTLIADPTKFWSMDSRNKTRLKSLLGTIQSRAKKRINQMIITPIGYQQGNTNLERYEQDMNQVKPRYQQAGR